MVLAAPARTVVSESGPGETLSTRAGSPALEGNTHLLRAAAYQRGEANGRARSGKRKSNAYHDQDRRLLRRVAELVAMAIENASTREALQEEKDRLRGLVEINRTLASRLEVQSLRPLISECVTRVVPHDFAGVTLFESDKENMKAYVLSPERSQPIIESGRPVSLNQTLSAQAFLEGEAKTLTRDDLESHGTNIDRK